MRPVDIAAWLEGLGLGSYAEAFVANDIDADTLRRLDADDLKELGVASLGHRKKLLGAIAALDAAPAVPAPPAPSRTAERRQLTVMFVDLVGSTALSARLDPEEMGEVLKAYQNAVTGEITRFEGHVAKLMGDGVLAYFGWPRAHEDEAERAARAGLAITAAVARLDGGGTPLACRVGIATGLVVVGDLVGEGAAQEEAVVGETPNLAARLQAVAGPGQVVIAEATRRLIADLFELHDLGPQRLKGIDAAAPAYAVTGARAVTSRFEARSAGVLPMVGRDQELALLLDHWARARVGEGQAVLLVGEAGVGKSRIGRALLDALAGEPHSRIRYQCSPYHTGSALWPVIRQLEHAARLAPADPPELALDKLEALLGEPAAAGDAALLARLLGLDGSARYGALELEPPVLRARTLAMLVGQLHALAATRPVLVVLEDAHWIDPTTLELIEQCLDGIAAAPVLMLVTSRPDAQPALAAHPHVTRLSLNRLGSAGVEAIVARLGGGRLPPATVDAIIARTDGVPLFVEELTKAVLETGESAIPASLHDSLMARLDRLPEVKEVAQLAACIGRELDHRLLTAVALQPEAAVTAALQRLTAAELIFRRGTPPDASYQFKHALVRDAAYESLLRSKRQELHGRIARALEERFPETATAQPELLARHFAEAGLAERAVGWWRAAGDVAVGRAAFDEAEAHLTTAQGQLASLADVGLRRREEAGIAVARALVSLVRNGYSDSRTVALYTAAEALARAAADPQLLLRAVYGVWAGHHVAEDIEPALRVARQMLDSTMRRRDSDMEMMAHRLLGTSQTMAGRLTDARATMEIARSLYDPARHRALGASTGIDPAIGVNCYWACAELALGHPDRARSLADAALELASADGTVNARAYALYHVGSVAAVARESARATALGTELGALSAARGLSFWGAMAPGIVAMGLLEHGDAAGAVARFSAYLAAAEATGAGLLGALWRSAMAEATALTGDEAALAMSAEAEARARRTGALYALAEAQRRQGVVLRRLRPDDVRGAEDAFRRALTTAREQSARLWELRAARDLARLLAERGERRRAHDLLAPILAWVTEGFDMPDLIEARALLDALT